MSKLLYIQRLVIAVLLLLLAVAPVMAQNVVYEGQTTTLDVEEVPGETYVWDLYNDSTVDYAITDGTAVADGDLEFVGTPDGSMVNVNCKVPGTYFYKVTALDAAGCTMNLEIGILKVIEAKPTAVITPPDPDWICVGESMALEVIFTGTGPWEFSYTDGVNSYLHSAPESTYLLPVSPKVPTQYWITGVKDKYGSNDKESDKVWIIVYPKPESSRIYPYEQ